MTAASAELRSRVRNAIDADELVALTQALIRIRSYTGSRGEADVAHFLDRYLRELALDTRLQAVDDERCDVIARWRGTGGGQTLMLNGHMDTNPEVLGWTAEPFAGTVKDGLVYGVGVCNMKGALAAYIAACQAVRRAGVELQGDLLLCFVVGEQQGGVGTLKLLEAGITADAFIVGEPCENKVVTLHAGVSTWRLSTIGRMRHISKQSEGTSAIELMLRVIETLRDLQFRGEDRPEYRGLRRWNVGSIRGGMGREYLDWRPGIVPDFCTVHLDVRYGPGQSQDTVRADLEGMLERLRADALPDLRWELEPLEMTDTIRRASFGPFEIDPDHWTVRTVARAYREVYGAEPEIGAPDVYKFYGTDAAHLWHTGGIPGVVCGPGGKQTTAPDEAMEIDELMRAAQIYALTIVDVCSTPIPRS
ncbi:MAG: M20/M25/M40 family metallo-hydrolase [Chloroflexi bacterium]|nr:M20/M25/M40 family metallo-hydrolase [Chloroflexota bacterium]